MKQCGYDCITIHEQTLIVHFVASHLYMCTACTLPCTWKLSSDYASSNLRHAQHLSTVIIRSLSAQCHLILV